MTKHDTWVKLKPGNPLEPIISYFFPDGMIPMRDPFPMERAKFEAEGLWIIDLERLSSVQAQALAQVIAQGCGAMPVEVATEAAAKGGFALKHQWVESMSGGPECFARSKELADWLETAPSPPSAEAWNEFVEDQYERWIVGDEVPPEINSLEDIDKRLHTPELDEAMKKHQVNQMLAGYSVFDVLTGRAMVDILNQTDPNNTYSLVGWDSLVEDEWDEDDDIYE